MDIEGEVTGYAAMARARRVEHERAGASHDAALGIIIRAFEDIDLLAQPRRLADDLPCLAGRGAVASDDGQTMRVLPQDAPPAAVLLAVLGRPSNCQAAFRPWLISRFR